MTSQGTAHGRFQRAIRDPGALETCRARCRKTLRLRRERGPLGFGVADLGRLTGSRCTMRRSENDPAADAAERRLRVHAFSPRTGPKLPSHQRDVRCLVRHRQVATYGIGTPQEQAPRASPNRQARHPGSAAAASVPDRRGGIPPSVGRQSRRDSQMGNAPCCLAACRGGK